MLRCFGRFPDTPLGRALPASSIGEYLPVMSIRVGISLSASGPERPLPRMDHNAPKLASVSSPIDKRGLSRPPSCLDWFRAHTGFQHSGKPGRQSCDRSIRERFIIFFHFPLGGDRAENEFTSGIHQQQTHMGGSASRTTKTNRWGLCPGQMGTMAVRTASVCRPWREERSSCTYFQEATCSIA
jgi:hypothetical protein